MLKKLYHLRRQVLALAVKLRWHIQQGSWLACKAFVNDEKCRDFTSERSSYLEDQIFIKIILSDEIYIHFLKFNGGKADLIGCECGGIWIFSTEAGPGAGDGYTCPAPTPAPHPL